MSAIQPITTESIQAYSLPERKETISQWIQMIFWIECLQLLRNTWEQMRVDRKEQAQRSRKLHFKFAYEQGLEKAQRKLVERQLAVFRHLETETRSPKFI